MGGGITMNYANAGIPVLLKETSQEFLDRGLATIKRNYSNSVKKGRFSQDVMDLRMSLITPTLTYDGFEEADIVTEAVFEGMELTLRYAFRRLKLHRLEANIQPGNSESIALVKRCGFVREGFSRRYLKIDRQWSDHDRWALLAENWRAHDAA